MFCTFPGLLEPLPLLHLPLSRNNQAGRKQWAWALQSHTRGRKGPSGSGACSPLKARTEGFHFLLAFVTSFPVAPKLPQLAWGQNLLTQLVLQATFLLLERPRAIGLAPEYELFFSYPLETGLSVSLSSSAYLSLRVRTSPSAIVHAPGLMTGPENSCPFVSEQSTG